MRALEADHPVVDFQVLALDDLAGLRVKDVPPLRGGLTIHQRNERLGKGVEVTDIGVDALEARVLTPGEQKILLHGTLPLVI
jgi:hypothetical protein